MDVERGYTFEKVCEITGGECIGHSGADGLVKHLLTDSRLLLAPRQTLFFAIKTAKNDGHLFIKPLYEKGVRFFVVEKAFEGQIKKSFPEAGFILVSHPLEALQKLTAFHRSAFSFPVAGITGSNGKTIIKEWLFQLLAEDFFIVRNPKSYNSQIGVPLSVWQMGPEHQLGIFEAGISLPGEMEKLREIIDPDIGIFSNIGPAHDEGFSSREQKIREKLKLFDKCKTLVYCMDHKEIHREVKQWSASHPEVGLFCWGQNQKANLQVLNLEKTREGTTANVLFHKQAFQINIPFSDEASVENALHCLAFSLLIGINPERVNQKMKQLQPVAMRLEMKEGVNGCTVINDSYNSDLSSLAIALDFMSSQSAGRPTTLILSDIFQTGLSDDILYREVASLVKSKKVNRLIGIGPGISAQASQFNEKAKFFPSTEAFLKSPDLTSFAREIILLKGSRFFEFEKISDILQQKDHQTVLEINLDALVHNFNVFRSLLKPSVKTMGVVKAFSYGSGSVEIATMLQYHHVDYLAVAYADEGKALRKGGVHLPIVVMNPEIRTYETLLEYNLEPEVYGMNLLRKLAQAMDSFPGINENSPLNIHLKLDTGMHRLGFLPAQLDELVAFIKKTPVLCVASVFSHFAASDDPSHDEFSLGQISLFKELCEKLEKELGYTFVRHMCNSAAISRFPQAHFDMVRAGIGLYGESHDEEIKGLLQPVSTFRSVVSQVKTVSKGETIGYNRSAKARENMEIAIVPVGYADGLNRRLGNGRGHLLVKDRKVPIVGNISMDMCAVDVTGMKVKEGDEVIIFGSKLPPSEIASQLGTIPYEVFTSVSQRVKRIYYQG